MSLPASVWIWMTQATTTLASALRHWMNTTTSNIINSVPVGDQFNNDLVISVIYIGGVHWFQRSPQLKLDSMCFIALSRFFANRYKKLFFARKRWCWFCVGKTWQTFINEMMAVWMEHPRAALPKCFKNKNQENIPRKSNRKRSWQPFQKIRLIFPIEWRCYDLLSNYGLVVYDVRSIKTCVWAFFILLSSLFWH